MGLTGSIIMLSILSFYAGIRMHQSGEVRHLRSRLIQAFHPVDWFRFHFGTEKEKIVVDIKQEDFQRIAYQRERALVNGLHFPQPGDWVQAGIRNEQDSTPIKIRLKGTNSAHWKHKRKWSYSIRVRGEHTFRGMKRFTLQDPSARHFIYEWLFMEALKREGLLVSRVEFLNLTVNGDDHGVYALEEHYDRRLIENNALREGAIIGFNKDLAVLSWMRALQMSDFSPSIFTEGDSFWASSIEGSQIDTHVRGSAEFAQFQKAVTLLESFRRSEKSASEVFDIEQMAKLMAIRAFFGSLTFDWRNMKFYFNPVTARLQPVDQEVHPGKLEDNWWLNDSNAEWHNDLIRFLFRDPNFYLRYISELKKVSDPLFLEDLLETRRTEFERNLRILYFGHWEHHDFRFSREMFTQNQKRIRSVLNPIKGGHAYLEFLERGKLRLVFGNLQPLPVKIVGISGQSLLEALPTKERVIAGREGEMLRYEPVEFKIPADLDFSDEFVSSLILKYRILGLPEIRELKIFPWSVFQDDAVRQDPRFGQPNFREFDFLTVDQEQREIFITPGDWTVSKSLIIPPGYSVFAGGGVSLRLTESALILSYSPLNFIGQESHPVRIEAADGVGMGIIVLGAQSRSQLKNVIFEGLSLPIPEDGGLTGVVTFYESDVTIEKCLFRRNRDGDDILNIIRSDFEIIDSTFSDTYADALDIDFCTGRILNSNFRGAKNDAIDTSGSTVTVEDIVIERAGDKGISVGEGSRLDGRRISIKEAEVAVSSKDSSTILGEKITIENSRVGFAIFQKKSEFGPGRAEIKDLNMGNIFRPYLVEENSFLSVDGRTVPGTERKVGDMVYGQVYGKASK